LLLVQEGNPTGDDPVEESKGTNDGEKEVLVLQRKQKKGYVPEKFTFFWKHESLFSQHHKCSFVIDNVRYNCAEQWMMQQKAILFGDEEMARKIMETDDPKRMQRMGRKIRGLDQEIWDEYSYDIVYKGNTHKFAQDNNILKSLRQTTGTTLIEASPYDRIWGIDCYGTELAAQRRDIPYRHPNYT